MEIFSSRWSKLKCNKVLLVHPNPPNPSLLLWPLHSFKPTTTLCCLRLIPEMEMHVHFLIALSYSSGLLQTAPTIEMHFLKQQSFPSSLQIKVSLQEISLPNSDNFSVPQSEFMFWIQNLLDICRSMEKSSCFLELDFTSETSGWPATYYWNSPVNFWKNSLR